MTDTTSIQLTGATYSCLLTGTFLQILTYNFDTTYRYLQVQFTGVQIQVQLRRNEPRCCNAFRTMCGSFTFDAVSSGHAKLDKSNSSVELSSQTKIFKRILSVIEL